MGNEKSLTIIALYYIICIELLVKVYIQTNIFSLFAVLFYFLFLSEKILIVMIR